MSPTPPSASRTPPHCVERKSESHHHATEAAQRERAEAISGFL
jgi:hypothetical protein